MEFDSRCDLRLPVRSGVAYAAEARILARHNHALADSERAAITHRSVNSTRLRHHMHGVVAQDLLLDCDTGCLAPSMTIHLGFGGPGFRGPAIGESHTVWEGEASKQSVLC